MSNDALELRGSFHQKSATAPGPPTLPKGAFVTCVMLESLRDSIRRVAHDWGEPKVTVNPIVSVRYTRTAAKSNRIRKLLTIASEDASDSIVGAKFDPESDPRNPKHIITYCVPMAALDRSIELLNQCVAIIDSNYANRQIDKEQLDEITREGFVKYKSPIPKTTFAQVIRETYFVEDVFIEDGAPDIMEDSFVTLYRTGAKTKDLLRQLGITVTDKQVIGETVRLFPDDYQRLRQNAPYLISMSVEDLSLYGPPDEEDMTGDSEDPEAQAPALPS